MEKGIRYHEKAAEVNLSGEGWTLRNIARRYLTGDGVRADPEKAFHLMLKSSESGYFLAQNELVKFYGEGIGTEIDYAAALEWALKAQKNNPSDKIAKSLQAMIEHYERLIKSSPEAVFNISVANAPTTILRYGNGPVGVVVSGIPEAAK